MNIWIATTGNSDVQLITDDNWSYLYEKERFNRVPLEALKRLPTDHTRYESTIADKDYEL